MHPIYRSSTRPRRRVVPFHRDGLRETRATIRKQDLINLTEAYRRDRPWFMASCELPPELKEIDAISKKYVFYSDLLDSSDVTNIRYILSHSIESAERRAPKRRDQFLADFYNEFFPVFAHEIFPTIEEEPYPSIEFF